MLRNWTWILPCWIWLWVFRTTAKDHVEVNGQQREWVRLNEEFVIVRIPVKGWKEFDSEDKKADRLRKIRNKQQALIRKLSKLHDEKERLEEAEGSVR